jgi:SPP1 gp7 family putative phage head morphogenesis protein
LIWGAHEIDGRIAALNAVKIRAALRQTIDATAIYQGYLDTHPVTSKNRALERAKARSWAILHVRFDNTPVVEVLKKVWSENYVLGQDSAKDAVRRAVEATKSSQYTDWQHWKAGNRAKELLLRPAGSLEKILKNVDVTIKGLDRVGYERVGSALADSFALGLSPSRSAKLILDTIADPARALTIAITEGSRAQSLATMDSYNELGLEQWEWSANVPCPECADNDGEIKPIGDNFSSGDSEPPVHPNCKCVMLPVIPDFSNQIPDRPNSDNGLNDLLPYLIGAGIAGLPSASSDTVAPFDPFADSGDE